MIKCKIEQLRTESEDAWIVSIPTTAVADTIVQFAALYLEKTNKMKFEDRCSGNSMVIEATNQGFFLSLNGKTIPVTKTWLEAIASVLTDTAMNGWSITSHIDQDLITAHETITVCICVDQPV